MNNWQLIITLVTFVLAVFGAGWLNQRASDKRFDDLHKRIDDLKVYFDARFLAMDARFTAIENRLDRIERQLEMIFKPSLPGR